MKEPLWLELKNTLRVIKKKKKLKEIRSLQEEGETTNKP